MRSGRRTDPRFPASAGSLRRSAWAGRSSRQRWAPSTRETRPRPTARRRARRAADSRQKGAPRSTPGGGAIPRMIFGSASSTIAELSLWQPGRDRLWNRSDLPRSDGRRDPVDRVRQPDGDHVAHADPPGREVSASRLVQRSRSRRDTVRGAGHRRPVGIGGGEVGEIANEGHEVHERLPLVVCSIGASYVITDFYQRNRSFQPSGLPL